MTDPEPLGQMSTCHVCGGQNKRTGRTRLEPPDQSEGLGDQFGQGERIRSEEYVCTQCGHRVWGQSGTEA